MSIGRSKRAVHAERLYRLIGLEVRPMQKDDWGSWDDVVKSSNEGLIYHSSAWLNTISASNPLKFESIHLVGIDRRGEIKAIFPLFLDHRFLIRAAKSIPYCSSGGICCKPDTINQISVISFLEFLDRIATERHLVSAKIYSSFLGNDDNHEYAYTRRGYTVNHDFQQFDLSIDKNDGKNWKNLGKKVRNSIRKSQKLGVEVFQAKTLKDLIDYYEVYSRTALKKGFTPKPFSFFKSLWERLHPNHAKVFLASLGGQVISGMILLCYKEVLHYWSAASKEGFLGFNANDLLLYDSIQWASKNGIRIFDLGSSTSNQAGVYRFKRKWGRTIFSLSHKTKRYPTKGFLEELKRFANSCANKCKKKARYFGMGFSRPQ